MAKILIRLPNWLGDAVMASGALARFAEEHQNDEITLTGGAVALPVFQHTPCSWTLAPLDQRWHQSWGRMRDAAKSLQKQQYDTGYLLPNSFSSAFLFRLGNIPQRIGYRAHLRSLLLTQALKKPHKDIHHSAVYNQLLNGSLETAEPCISLLPDERDSVQALMHRSGVAPGRIIGIAAGAAYGPAKCWPWERYAQLAQRCVNELGANVILLGSKAEADAADAIAQQAGHGVVSFAGKTSLRQLFALIEACDVVACNDSGVMHATAALKRPTLTFIGPTNAAATGPIGTQAVLLNKNLDCAPCMKRTCPLKHHNCMTEISIDEAMGAMLELIAE